MNDQFQRLIDAHGADLARWPVQDRADAERLLETDPASRAQWERARQFDERLARHLIAASEQEARAEHIGTSRVLAALTQLPAQRRQDSMGRMVERSA